MRPQEALERVETAKTIELHINISRSGKQRKIKGIHGKMSAGRRNISINGTGV